LLGAIYLVSGGEEAGPFRPLLAKILYDRSVL
jgi:hypothetical protein